MVPQPSASNAASLLSGWAETSKFQGKLTNNSGKKSMPCGRLAFAFSTRLLGKAPLSRFLSAYETSTTLYGEIPNTHFA